MRKIILYIAVSIDGFIARPDGAVDWLNIGSDTDYGYGAFNDSVDSVLMGYSTYEISLTLAKDPFKGKKYFVFTRKQKLPSTTNVTFVNEDISAFVRNLKLEKTGKDIWLMGGGNLIKSVIEAGVVIDDWMIFIIPTILGEGIPLFQDSGIEQQLKLVEFEAFKNGVVFTHYR